MRVSSTFGIAALTALLAGPAGATDWVVDPGTSRLDFSGTQTGTKFEGRFAKFDATISFDPASPAAGHAVVLIDMASATTGDVQRDRSLPQADWFNVKAFPQARFEATGFRDKGGGDFEAVCKLTIRNVSQDCVLPFHLAIDGDTAKVKGHLDLVRTAFGVGQGSWSKGDMVGLQVGVDIDLTAHRKP